eukprot:tig00000630_g2727.t1
MSRHQRAGPAAATSILVLLYLASTAHAWQWYQSDIPNGANVKRNGVAWAAVGHLRSTGKAARAAGRAPADRRLTGVGRQGGLDNFGNAFKQNGNSWTAALCKADSDGDGYSNGWELGDPCCTWSLGRAPSRTSDISDPGLASSRPTSAGCVASAVATPSPSPTPRPAAAATTAAPAPTPLASVASPAATAPPATSGSASADSSSASASSPAASAEAQSDLIQIVLLVSFSAWSASGEMQAAFLTGVAAAAGVDASRVQILNAVEGSVVVSLVLLPAGAAGGLPVAEAASRLGAAIAAQSLALTGLPVDYSRTRAIVPGGENDLVYHSSAPYHFIVLGVATGAALAAGCLVTLALPPHRGPAALLAYTKPLLRLGVDLSLGEALALLLYLAASAAYAAYYAMNSTKGTAVGRAGDAFGRVAELQLLFALLPVARNSLWQHFFGIAWERAVRFHRWAAVAMVASVWLHGGLLALYFSSVPGLGASYLAEWGGASEDLNNLAGLLSGALMLLLSLLSLPQLRRALFERFYFMHFLFVPAVVFACIHERSVIAYAVPPAALYAADCAFRAWKGRARPARLLSLRLLDGRISRLEVSKPGMGAHGSGQFVFLQLPALSGLEWHPMSISSDPSQDGRFTLHIRDRGPDTFTGRLAALAKAGVAPGSVALRVDGPYGRPSVRFERYPSLAVVCGGIGIAPALSTLGWLLQGAGKDGARLRRVDVLWLSRDEATLLAFDDALAALEARATAAGVAFACSTCVTRRPPAAAPPPRRPRPGPRPGAGQQRPAFQLVVIDPEAGAGPAGPAAKRPRPDLDVFFAGVAAAAAAAAEPGRGGPVAVFTCGPGGLMGAAERAAQRAAARAGVPFHTHKETFDL